ncbi:inositol monophosphatase [Actinokineospora sp. PR83]|uniref:inositol monophosphatase family protein n=1 Tax=Actinokineospora sp. PR83 TaxID=2884908 RepID=UPI0027DEF4BE|nr:inositol monophosphatase [Actinokineospora sp. PR83]MCG8916960.1 inositol monophosphatase [Actinokineospora sp. PR83]
MRLDLYEAAQIANKAVDLAVHLFTTLTPDQVISKSDRDTVTNVDLTIEREVRDYLHSQLPNAGFLGEEDGQIGPADGAVWVLDPIDGTANFTHGMPLSGISLALIINGAPVIGVIATPKLANRRYTAIVGEGSWCGTGRLMVSATVDPRQAIVSIGDYATGPGSDEKNANRLRLTEQLSKSVERVRMFGSAAVDLAWVSEGITDAVIMLVNKPWDTAAGVLIAAEAGAIVLDHLGEPHNLHSPSLLVANPSLARKLVQLIR